MLVRQLAQFICNSGRESTTPTRVRDELINVSVDVCMCHLHI